MSRLGHSAVASSLQSGFVDVWFLGYYLSAISVCSQSVMGLVCSPCTSLACFV